MFNLNICTCTEIGKKKKKESLKTTTTHQQFREKTRTLTESALAMLADEQISDEEF